VRELVCVPTYNEADNIAEFLQRTRRVAPSFDILVIDDSSPDGTAAIAKDIAGELGQIDILLNPSKIGLGAAYREGFGYGLEHGYDVICQIDADLSFDPADLPRLVTAVVENDVDLAVGSRYMPGGSIPDAWPSHRRALSRYGNLYAKLLLGMRLADATSGFRAFRASAVRDAGFERSTATGYGIQIEMAYRLYRRGLSIVEIPVKFDDRTRGVSKMSWSIFSEQLRLVTWWGVRDRLLRRRH
jgi:glycosyltransferase involved in cell wall biosynthesis